MTHKSYTKNHSLDECDKCLKKVGKNNLVPIPFLYLDKNDDIHKDMSPKLYKDKIKRIEEVYGHDPILCELVKKKVHVESGYRQYYICEACFKNGY